MLRVTQSLARVAGLLTIVSLFASAPSQDLASRFGGVQSFGASGFDRALGVTYGSAGERVVVGEFSGSVDFDPGPGIDLRSSHGERDAFIARWDATGTRSWVLTFGGSSFDRAESVAIRPNGSIIVAGVFRDLVDLDPGIGSAVHASMGEEDVFIQEFDALGNLIFVGALQGTGRVAVGDVHIDAMGRTLIGGQFAGSVDFDPGSGNFTLVAGSNQAGDGFGLILDPSMALESVVQLEVLGSGQSVVVGMVGMPSGDMVMAGSFSGPTDFDPAPTVQTLTPFAGWDGFLARYSSTGALLWSGQMGGADAEFCTDLARDAGGHLILAGTHQGSGDYDPGLSVASLPAAGVRGNWIARFHPDLTLDWVRHFTGELGIDVAIASDAAAHILVGGSFANQSTFISRVDRALEDSDGYLARLSPSGQLGWLARIEGRDHQFVQDVAARGVGRWTAVGQFAATADFDAGPAARLRISNGSRDGFIAHYGETALRPLTLSQPGGPGTGVFLDVDTPAGAETFNVFNREWCALGPGAGPERTLGLCLDSPSSQPFIISQLLLPLGSGPFHYLSPGGPIQWGPYFLPPMALEAVSFTVASGLASDISQVTRLEVQ